MNPTAWAAVSAIVGTLALGVALVIHIIKASYDQGVRDQRLKVVEEKVEKQPSLDTPIALLTAAVRTVEASLDRIEKSVSERIDHLEQDLRNLLTGRVKPASRKPDDNG